MSTNEWDGLVDGDFAVPTQTMEEFVTEAGRLQREMES